MSAPYSPSPTGAGVEALRRLSSPEIGADREQPGRFAVYFYDAGHEVLVAGGYESASLAASAVDWIRADAVVKAEGAVWSATRQCTRCDGGGEVYWNPSPINDPQLEEAATCPRCDGEGTEPEEEHDGR